MVPTRQCKFHANSLPSVVHKLLIININEFCSFSKQTIINIYHMSKYTVCIHVCKLYIHNTVTRYVAINRLCAIESGNSHSIHNGVCC